MPGIANLHRPRVPPQGAAWTSLAVVVLAVVGVWATSGRETVVVPHENARDLVALFGDAWSEPVGPLRITGGRMEGGIVRVSVAGPGREASLQLEHRRARAPLPPGAVEVEQPGNDVVIVIACTPACDPPSIAPLRALAEHVLAGNPARLWTPVRGFAEGRERVVACAAVLGLVCAAALVGLCVLYRARFTSPSIPLFQRGKRGADPMRRQSHRWLVDALLVSMLCLAATALLGEPSIANWYSNNLPPEGGILAVEDQNGTAGFLVQLLVRSVLPWTDRTLFGLNLVLHATSGGVFYLAFRMLGIARGVAWLAAVLWMVLPLSVRAGWSDAQHVQVELLFAVLLVVWLRAQDQRHWPERLLGPLLAALVPFIRIEALVLAPVPLLFGPAVRVGSAKRLPSFDGAQDRNGPLQASKSDTLLVGDRPWRRRLVDALVYAGLLALSARAVWELFVRRYDIPIPDLASQLRSLVCLSDYVALFRQFVTVNSGMPNWFPWPATVLLVVGLPVLLVRRPVLLAAVLFAFCIPQLLLGRWFNAEGVVGARYFLALLPLLALVAAFGLAAAATGVGRLFARVNGTAGTAASAAITALGVLAVVVAALPLYRYEYAFQGEYRFLRETLATLPGDARVLHLPVREDDRIHADPDCCLDPAHSPLALAFPSVRFEALPIRPERPQLPAAVDERTYYYEGALCRLAPTPASEGRNPGLSRLVDGLCATLARDPRLEPVAAVRVPSNGFWAFLHPGPVPLRLYRVRPQTDGLRDPSGGMN